MKYGGIRTIKGDSYMRIVYSFHIYNHIGISVVLGIGHEVLVTENDIG